MTHEYTEAGLYDVIVSESLLLTDKSCFAGTVREDGQEVLCSTM